MGALCVSQPTEIRSTPVAAMAGAVAGLTRPDASVIARPATMAHRAWRASGGSILSSSTASTPSAERLLELAERIDLELDLDEMADTGARALQRGADAAGDRDMVVLDQHRIVEAEAVIGAAAGADRIFLDRAQARRRLARADDPRLVARDRGDDGGRRAGDAAEAAEEVQRRALGGEDAARRPGRWSPWRRPARAPMPSGRSTATVDRRIDQAEGEHGEVEARRRRRLAGDEPRRRLRASAGTMASVVRSPARPRSSSSVARTSGSIMMAGEAD